MSDFRIRLIDMMAVEFRVLPFRQFIGDNIYFAWCIFWFSMPVPIWQFVMFRLGWLDGCRGYFEWRDSNEYPVIGRWCRMQWTRWRNARYDH